MQTLKILIYSFILLSLITACKTTEEKQEENVVDFGKTVTFDYATGFYNGTLFDTSIEDAAREAGIFDPNRVYGPEKAVIGKDPLLPSLLEALLGMKEGETKNVKIPPEKAYGDFIENATTIVDKDSFNNAENLKVGDLVAIVSPQGQKIPVFVKKINKENITVDLNHPLAGEFIQFAILVRSIE